jgi:hypothetical protein
MKLFKLTLTVAIVAFLSNAAMATTWYSTGNNAWSTANSWNTARNGQGTPGNPAANDEVVIQDGHTVTVSTTTVSVTGVSIESGSTGGTLRMESTGATTGQLMVQDYIRNNGAFVFNESTNTRPIVTADNTTCEIRGQFTMTGSQGGQFTDSGSNAFKVRDGDEITFLGSSTAQISAPFEVDGTLEADGANVTFSDVVSAGEGLFRVINEASTVLFASGSSGSLTDADFKITDGTLQFSVNITTTGGYQQTGGTCVVDAGATFTASGAY